MGMNENPRIPNKNKRNENPDDYNTIDDVDDYLRTVAAADSFRIMGFNGNGG